MDTSWFKNIIGKLSFSFNRTNSPNVKNVMKVKSDDYHYGPIYNIIVNNINPDNKSVSQGQKNKIIDNTKEAFLIDKKRRAKLIENITSTIKNLNSKELDALKEPLIQYDVSEALKSVGKISDESLRATLSSLVEKRIKNDTKEDDLKKIVYSESIRTIEKLTINQLKIITLCYLVRYTRYSNIRNWKDYGKYLNHSIKPFLSFKNTEAEFQHIEYAGCGNISIGNWDLIEMYRVRYSCLFLLPIKGDEIKKLQLPASISNEVFLKEDNRKYSFSIANKFDLENYFNKKGVNQDLRQKISHFYDSKIDRKESIKEKLIKYDNNSKKLMSVCNETKIKNMSLTSVGITIAATYFEQVTGDTIDINIWIN